MLYLIKDNKYYGEYNINNSPELVKGYKDLGHKCVWFSNIPDFHTQWVNTPARENENQIIVNLSQEQIKKIDSEITRNRRDTELNATDFYLMPDYPISSELLVQIKEYRQQLRHLPQQDGFPYVDFPVSPISK